MKNFFNWIKQNKLVIFILLVLAWLVWQSNYFKQFHSFNSPVMEAANLKVGESANPIQVEETFNEMAPSQDVDATDNQLNRLVVQNSSLSMVVEDVPATAQEIISIAKKAGGYMVNKNLHQVESKPTATVTVRVPANQLDQVLATFKDQASKVVWENLDGQDVTDSYTDIKEHLRLLNTTKQRYEKLRDQTSKISDLLRITQELTNLQHQIDSYEGQQRALETQASQVKITVYLATDEIALPYHPDKQFRPKVVFKLAVRSLLSTMYGLMSKLIWLVVYAVIWVPILIIVLFGWKKIRKNK